MYELFILGQLMDHPMTGYQLRKALINVVGQELTISFGALYPLLDKLAAAGYLSLDFKHTTSRRPQKLATLTLAGQNRFHKLVVAPVALNKQTQLTFQMKLNFLHLLTVAERLAVLTDFEQFGRGQLARLAAQAARIRGFEREQADWTATHPGQIQDNPHMVAADIRDALAVNELQRVRAQAQVTWLTTKIEAIEREQTKK